jgi:hypothetical protein
MSRFFGKVRHTRDVRLQQAEQEAVTGWTNFNRLIEEDFPELFGRRSDADAERRQRWFRDRLWHNGAHAQCCPKCLQAGYVMALVRANRLDLLGEYPELIAVYKELLRDGILKPLVKRQ